MDAARERVERARVGREELVSVLAAENPVNTSDSVPPSDDLVAAVAGSNGFRAERGERPPVWRSGMGETALSGICREVFAAVVAASGPVNGVRLTRAVGREPAIKNEVEKIRHRAYVLEKRGWLVRAKDGRFMPASELGVVVISRWQYASGHPPCFRSQAGTGIAARTSAHSASVMSLG